MNWFVLAGIMSAAQRPSKLVLKREQQQNRQVIPPWCWRLGDDELLRGAKGAFKAVGIDGLEAQVIRAWRRFGELGGRLGRDCVNRNGCKLQVR